MTAAARTRTRTRERELNRQLRDLRREWKWWRSGQAINDMGWYGLPWCEHRQPVPGCEGCPIRGFCAERVAEVAARAEEIRLELEGPAEGELLALTARGWVTV